MKLFIYEYKKIVLNKMNLVSLFLFTICVIIFFQVTIEPQLGVSGYMGSTSGYVNKDGQLMSFQEVDEIANKEISKWSGIADSSWYQKFMSKYEEAIQWEDYRTIDFKKMNKLYGSSWYEDYKNDPEKYYEPNPLKEKTKEQIEIIYRDEILPKKIDDISNDVVLYMYINFVSPLLIKQSWNNSNAYNFTAVDTYNLKKVDFIFWTDQNLSQKELTYLKNSMNKNIPFYFGNSKNLYSFLSTFNVIAILLSIWVLFISASSVNKERATKTLELISTSAKGYKNIIFNKYLATIASSITGSLFMILFFTLFALLTNQLGDFFVNITESGHNASIYTYGEGYLISILMVVIGSIALSSIGFLMSTLIKSSYKSIILSIFLFSLIFIIFTLNIPDYLCPVKFMGFNTILMCTNLIFDKVFIVWKLIPFIWISISLMLFFIAYRIYCSKKFIKYI